MTKQCKRAGLLVLVMSMICAQAVWAATNTRVVVFGLDETGSYSFREKAINMAKAIVAGLEPGDVFYLRRITDKSYDDSSAVFRLQVPEIGGEPQNRFDPRARAAWLKSKRGVEQTKAQAQAVLSSLEIVKSPRTDIWGFFAAAADRFQLEGKPVKMVVVASDMKHNHGVKAPIDLKGCEVHVVGFETGSNPLQAQKIRATWLSELKRCKASLVNFHPIDQTFTMKPR